VEVFGSHVSDCSVGYAGIAIFAGVDFPGFFPSDYDFRTGLYESEFGVPEFEIFINISNKGQYTFSFEWFCGHVLRLPECLVVGERCGVFRVWKVIKIDARL
jgi:hypothetical protein